MFDRCRGSVSFECWTFFNGKDRMFLRVNLTYWSDSDTWNLSWVFLAPWLSSISSIWFSSAFVFETIDWSVCLLALKHLVSLQDRVWSSVQAELDLHTADRWEERDRKKKWYICSLKRLPYRRRLALVFFFFGFTEVVCVYIHYRSVSVCVYSTIVCLILFMPATLLDVCVLSSFASLYTYRLNYFNVTIGI